MTNSIDPFRAVRSVRSCNQRFAPIVGSAVSMCLVSISGNLSHSLSYYARIHYLPSEYAVVASGLLVVTMCAGLRLVTAGYRYGPLLLISVAALNVLLSLGYFSSHPPTVFALFPLFGSLFYLIILNSKNHRRYTSMLRVKRRRKIRANAAFP